MILTFAFTPYQGPPIRFRALLISIVAGAVAGVIAARAKAQVIPDSTLPVNSAAPEDCTNCVITGGTPSPNNRALFHSFQQFSIPNGGSAIFQIDPGLTNLETIITRVTGVGENFISNIDGLLAAPVDFFLLNPNGIVFGPNASLNIGGSFIASTADTLLFADDAAFSTATPDVSALLTISAPIGLQFGQNPADIQVQGEGHNLTGLEFLPILGAGGSGHGLRVQAGRTLGLVGGEVALTGAILTAPGGRIELGAVGIGDSGPNQVSLTPTAQGWRLGYEGVQNFQDIRLSQQALADGSGFGGGAIQVQGHNISSRDGSMILIQNQGLQPSGDIIVNAAESLELSGTTPNALISGLQNETVAFGSAGDIQISTERLIIRDGSQIGTRTFTHASGGDVAVKASESLQLLGFSLINPNIPTSLSASTLGSGDAGDITISTGRLSLVNGATLSSSTFGFGAGGDVSVNASESIELIGVIPNLFQPSLLAAITLNTGNAGDLAINTARLVIRDGGRVDSSTLAFGDAGSITINAAELVDVSGTVPGSVNPSLIISSANRIDTPPQEFLRLPDAPSGESGDVTINTPGLRVTDGAIVSVRNDGVRNAGMLQVNADLIALDRGAILASSLLGEGGDINLQVQDAIVLRNHSIISTQAGAQDSGGGNGGNIAIETGFITSVPEENSDITANAFSGRGGNITITAQGIFGIEFREARTPLSDITASSEIGVDGMVEINTLETDPSSGSVELPNQLADPSDQITAGCPANQENTFFVSGQGGLPVSPTQRLQNQSTWQDWRFLENRVGSPSATLRPQFSNSGENRQDWRRTNPNAHSAIVEATGWMTDSSGQIRLIAKATERRLAGAPSSCHQDMADLYLR